MSLSNIQADASCDKCGAGLRFRVDNIPGIRRKMRAAGWGSNGGGNDLCPACVYQLALARESRKKAKTP